MINKIMIVLILFYKKWISPLLPGACRFAPTCSEYSISAYKEYNFFYATYLSINRIMRCNPLSKGYEDPLPKKKHSN